MREHLPRLTMELPAFGNRSMANAETIAVVMRPECDRDHIRREKEEGASDMWVAESRIDAMETRIYKLEEQIHSFPQQIELAVSRALEAHERREKEWISAVSEKITDNIFECLLGEDLATGQDAAKNRRAMQQMLRQGVSMAPLMVRVQSGFLLVFCIVFVGVVFLLAVSSGTLIEFIKLKMKVWMGL